jgi:Na+-translocating ferredoxin:NAD+ oxidoreductase subunit B
MNITAIAYAIALLGGLGIVFGIVLTIAEKKFSVKLDDRVARVRECLPGANCGACGFAGCDAFAAAVIKGDAPVNGCTAGGKKTAQAVAGIMQCEVKTDTPTVARVRCQGECEVASERFEYTGIKSCRVAAMLSGGPKNCNYSCLGLGDCQSVCKFDAIKMQNGIAVIDQEKCTACKMCVSACPRSSIEMIPKPSNVVVLCLNADQAKAAREACTKACIACKRCEKACKYDAVHVLNQCAVIDTAKCTSCGDCIKACPNNCIRAF